jgi:hypothetical protein
MSTTEPQKDPLNTPNSHSTLGHYVTDDEISLLELWDGLVARWKLMLSIVSLGTVISIVGAIVYIPQEPEFNVVLHLLPPKHQDIEPLYLPTVITMNPTETTPWTPKAPKVINVSAAHVFAEFHTNLVSGPLQSKFLSESSAPLSFNVGLDINNLYVSSDWHNPDRAKQWAIDYVEFIAQYTIAQILTNLQNSIDSRVRVIQHSLDFLHIVANKQKKTAIIQLKEALNIAKRLNVVEPIVETPLPPDSVPLYYIGSKAIQAQLDAYMQSKSLQLDSHDAAALSTQLKQLQEIDIRTDGDGIRVVEIIQEATVSEKPLQLTATKIVAVGILMSCLGAMFLAFCVFFIHRQRLLMKDRHSE